MEEATAALEEEVFVEEEVRVEAREAQVVELEGAV